MLHGDSMKMINLETQPKHTNLGRVAVGKSS